MSFLLRPVTDFTKPSSIDMHASPPSSRYGCAKPLKHIMFIAPTAYPLGGVATWLDYIVPGLREKNWNVTLGLIGGRFHDIDTYLRVHPDEQVLRIPYGTGTAEGRIRQIMRALCRATPDIVLSVNVGDVSPAVDRIRAKYDWSPRVAMTLHAVQADFVSSASSWAEVLDAIICTNHLTCALVSRLTPVKSDRIYYAPYGVDANSKTYKKPRGGGDILRVGYVGRLENAQKRIDDLGSILSELDRRGLAYELVIAGGGPDEQSLRDQLSPAVTKGRVRFVGSLSPNELAEKVYRRLDVLLITSLWETGPIVAWEAMAHGVVVVSSDYIGSGLEGSLRANDNCLMFPIGDAVAATDCLERVRDPKLRRRLAQNGQAMVCSRYSKTASIENWDSCLRRIATKPPLTASRRSVTGAPPAGRLDRLFGCNIGESLREILRVRYDHGTPGGEWPHTNTHSQIDEEAFWRLAMSLDRSGSGSN